MLMNFISFLTAIFVRQILFDIYLLSLIIAVVYSGAVIVIFLFLLMIMDSAQIDCVSDEDKSIYLVLALVHMFSINLL